MARKIVITSGKGGVGKTTICANLGMRLSSLGNRVCMLDTDIGLNNLDVVMNVENRVVYDLADVVEGRCRIKQALIQDLRYPTLFVLPSSHLFTDTKITSYSIKAVVEQLAETFDYILIDCPAGIDSGFHRAVYAANEAIIITTPNLSSIRDASKVLTILGSYNLDSVGFIANRVRGDLTMRGKMLSTGQMCSLLNCDLYGIVPDDDSVGMLSCTNPFKTVGGDAFKILAENIHFGKNRLYDYTAKYRGFLGGIKRSLRKHI
ncbi:MAG: septum site-determining protein MinD [Clostridiales bacterium]|nr:septum site-determining protein MinD [Candidatus Apopatousia equi]